jgi:uncharacterized membrane protein YjfL (UPF0719 family)
MALPAACWLLIAQNSHDFPPAAAGPWHAETFGEAVIATLVFGLVGIFLAIIGFKIFDWVTPGHLDKEILEKQNMAAAIIAGAVVIGICIIVARAVG